MARPRVLLTGFGPFPGVAENPSGWLASALAARCATGGDLHAQVLPTEWAAVAALTPRLYETLQPHVMIHFGVSPRAKTLKIERSAHNRAASRRDARGALPVTPAIAPDGTMRLDTALPVTEIAARLRASGHRAASSRSCGRYLCNFLYYRSLEWAQARGRDALFVHVPPLAAQGGSAGEHDLLRAAETVLHLVLDCAADRRAAAPSRIVEARP